MYHSNLIQQEKLDFPHFVELNKSEMDFFWISNTKVFIHYWEDECEVIRVETGLGEQIKPKLFLD